MVNKSKRISTTKKAKASATSPELANITVSDIDLATGCPVVDYETFRIPIADSEAFSRAVGRLCAAAVEDAKPKAFVIWSWGKSQFSVNDGTPIYVSDKEDELLRSFINQPAQDEALLKINSGDSNPARTLRELRKKYNGMFADAIIMPVIKSRGGYRATVIEKHA